VCCVAGCTEGDDGADGSPALDSPPLCNFCLLRACFCALRSSFSFFLCALLSFFSCFASRRASFSTLRALRSDCDDDGGAAGGSAGEGSGDTCDNEV
jgi:hypothetical protein